MDKQIIDGKDYYDGLRRGSDEDKARKKAKVKKLVRQARSCQSFEGLEAIGDSARSQGLWHAENGVIPEAFKACNARLRGRHEPALFVKGNLKVTVFNNEVVKREPTTLQVYTPKQASRLGFLYQTVKEVMK